MVSFDSADFADYIYDDIADFPELTRFHYIIVLYLSNMSDIIEVLKTRMRTHETMIMDGWRLRLRRSSKDVYD